MTDTAALDLTTGMTLEAWVQPTSTNRWRTVALKEQTGNLVYALYGNNSGQRASANLFLGGSEAEARSAGQLPANVWTHLAATYDGATIRLYVNGTLSGSTTATGSLPASTGPFRIGGNAIWDEFFSGQLDDLRLYNRALSATEVQADMATPVGPPPPIDTQAPSAPGALGATGGLSSVTLSWTASTDNVGVVRYNVHRSTTSGFTPSAANRISQPTGTGYTDPGLAPGTYYYRVTAEDAAGNISASSNQATGVVTGDVTPPGPPGTLQATGALGSASLSWSAATDNVGVVRYNVHRSTVAGFVPGVSNRIAQPTGTTYTDNVSAGTYFYRVTAEDAAGNVGAPSNEASATVTSDTTAPTVAVTAPAGGTTVSGTVTVQASASDNVAVTSVQFTLDGAALGAADTSAPYSTSWATTTATAGPHTLRAVARDAAGNETTSAGVTVTVDNSVPPPPTGLVAAWSFDAGTGTTAADATGKGHTGTISGATWSATGRNGGALSFDGVNDWVTVADANDLDLSNGMTLSAWVNPTGAGADWQTVLLKETPGFMVYALYADTDTARPSGHVVIGGSDLDTRGTDDRREQRLDAPRSDLRRREPSPLRQRHSRLDPRRHRQHKRLHRRSQDRRQRDLGRVVRRPDRQRAHLRARPLGRRDPDRHERGRHSLSKTARGRLSPPPRVTASSRAASRGAGRGRGHLVDRRRGAAAPPREAAAGRSSPARSAPPARPAARPRACGRA